MTMWTGTDYDPDTALGGVPLLTITETGVAEPCAISLDAETRIALARALLSGTGQSVGYAAVAAPAALGGVR